MWFILFMVIKDIVEPFLGPSEVAHMAHLAGSLAGFGVGMLLLGAGLIHRDHYDMLALLDRWRRRKQYGGSCFTRLRSLWPVCRLA